MKIITVFLLLLAVGFSNAFAGTKYTVDSDNSVVNFSTIKKQYVVEPAFFKKIEGSISDSGNVKISIDLNSVDTKIGIRDSRIESLFFKVIKFPKAIVRAKVDLNKIGELASYGKMDIPATLEFYGKTKKITLNVLVAKVYKNRLLITSMEPIIINADDYGIPAGNLVNLAKKVGGISISSKAAVNFVLTLKASE